jgi:hypothetical protein
MHACRYPSQITLYHKTWSTLGFRIAHTKCGLHAYPLYVHHPDRHLLPHGQSLSPESGNGVLWGAELLGGCCIVLLVASEAVYRGTASESARALESMGLCAGGRGWRDIRPHLNLVPREETLYITEMPHGREFSLPNASKRSASNFFSCVRHIGTHLRHV